MDTVENLTIDWMREHHIHSAMEIERMCFPEHPWSYLNFKRCVSTFPCLGYVAEIESEIVGYAVVEILDKVIEITNLAVHPDHQRSGVGTSLFHKIMEKATNTGYLKVCASVSDQNQAAHLFFRSVGARAVEVVLSTPTDFYVFERCVDLENIR